LTENLQEKKWVPLIRKALSRPLPGASAHIRMLPPGRSFPSPDQWPEGLKTSSVLILLYPENQEIYCCLLKRQPYLRNHGGQIGFPGGRMEEGDKSLLYTALRECREEIGVATGEQNILGSLSTLYVSVSGFLIHPFVAWLPSKPNFSIDFQEVEKLLFLPVLTFLQEDRLMKAIVDTFTGSLEVPAWELEGEIIWGATAMILAEFFDILKQQPEE